MVEDVNETMNFYELYFGFKPVSTVPDKGAYEWAIVSNGKVSIMFQKRSSLEAEVAVLKGKQIGATLTLFIDCTGIKEIYDSVKGNLRVVLEWHETFYGTYEFAVEDCNGYILAFSEKK